MGFEQVRFRELIRAARSEDQHALNAVRETAHWLAVGISNIAYTLNPATIVVAGEITRLWKAIEDDLLSSLPQDRFNVQVRPARLRAEQSLVHGAACLALSSLFTMPRLGIQL
jgi:predicted NBD/HSP70 family sugar kinase